MRIRRLDQRVEVAADLIEMAEYLVQGGESGRYVVKTVVNRGQSSQYVVISTGHRLVDGIRAHGVLTRCVLSSRADHAGKATAVQAVAVGTAQSVPRYSGMEYSAGD